MSKRSRKRYVQRTLNYVSHDGDKFPKYNSNYNLHSVGTKRYANVEKDSYHAGEKVHALPTDGYPYTEEYKKVWETIGKD